MKLRVKHKNRGRGGHPRKADSKWRAHRITGTRVKVYPLLRHNAVWYYSRSLRSRSA